MAQLSLVRGLNARAQEIRRDRLQRTRARRQTEPMHDSDRSLVLTDDDLGAAAPLPTGSTIDRRRDLAAVHTRLPRACRLAYGAAMKNLVVLLVVAACGGAPPPAATSAGATASAGPTRPAAFTPTSFGVEVSGAGRPVILIPGLGCPGSIWQATVAHLAPAAQVHVLTLAGFAGRPRSTRRSSPPCGPSSPATSAIATSTTPS
jgi:hypothetical protein